MTQKELRLGNWVNYNYKDINCEVMVSYETFRTFQRIEDNNTEIIEFYTPIPISEEWLLKFGFEKIVYDSEETGYGIEYHLDLNSRTKMIVCDDFSFGIENSQLDTHWLSLDFDKFDGVHHLQNIWHALTNEELKL